MANAVPIERLKKRAGFERLTREGQKCATGTLVIQALPGSGRAEHGATGKNESAPARLGFTTSRKLGNAVVRNRIRRRLKAAAAQLFPACAQAGMDYVIVGRARAQQATFETILKDMRFAVDTLHRFFNKGDTLKNR